MKIMVGLGNPGDKYFATRHNLGFTVLDEWVKKIEDRKWKMENRFKAEMIKYGDLVFIKPQTYMNNSGMAVRSVADFYKVKPEDIIIIHDELDLPLGKIKVRRGGAAAGHHGVESVIEHLGSDNFARVRLGIGNLRSKSGERNGQHFNAEKFVVEPFLPSEASQVKHMLKKALSALDILLEEGLEKAQNQFN